METKISRATAQISELDLRISESGNLASMKEPSSEQGADALQHC
jgi:hypothetical protein